MGQRNWQESPSPLIVGCTRYTTSSKRKGPGDSLAMQEGHPRRLHQQALLIILSSNNLIAHVESGLLLLCFGTRSLRKNDCGTVNIQWSAH